METVGTLVLSPTIPEETQYAQMCLRGILKVKTTPVQDESSSRWHVCRAPPIARRSLKDWASGVGVWGLLSVRWRGILKGSWDLVSRVITKVTILITPIRGLITLLTKSHDPPSRGPYAKKTAQLTTKQYRGLNNYLYYFGGSQS